MASTAVDRIEQARDRNLPELDLSHLALESLPPELSTLTQLTTLNLNRNALTELPQWLSNLTQLKTLRLDFNELTALPEWIGEFTRLSRLDLDYNRLTALPASLATLTELRTLYLDNNALARLPDGLGNLTKLATLSLTGTELTELPRWLGNLTDLITLHVDDNKLPVLPEWIGNLTELDLLNLSGNGLTDLPDSLGNLTQLTTLTLDRNALAELPAWIGNLTRLDYLDADSNRLAQLPQWLGDLTRLKRLSVGNNRLTRLPDSLGNLTQLTTLNIDSNALTRLPEWLGNLTQLTTLDVGHNVLTDLPDSLGNFPHLTMLNVAGNPLRNPPPEVIASGTASILAFLRERIGGTEQIWRSKLLVVGEATVGKTTLAKQLTGGVYDPGETQTHGVHVDALELPHPAEPDTTMQLAVWDFGGQLEYRATQRFYLTDRSLFLLVWNARARWQDGKLLAWLDTVTARAPSSPIMIVATHRDDASAATLPEDLRERYPSIVAIHEVDARSGRGVDTVRESVRQQAAALPLMGASWPRTWIEATGRISRIDQHAAPASQLWQTMADAGIDDPQAQRTLARCLHDLGDIVFFVDDPSLDDKAILRPAWLDARITQVLDSGTVATARGVLSRAERARLWADLDPDLYDRLLRMMERFDLAYRVGDSETSQDVALIVERLGYSQPQEVAPLWKQALAEPGACEVGLDFELRSRQAGIPSWFIARQHRYTTGLHWAHGVLLHDRSEDFPACALVLDEGAERPTIRIRVRGRHPAPFLSVLAEAFRNIVEPRYPGLIAGTAVPCLCQQPPAPLCGHTFAMAELLAELEDPDPEAGKVRCPVSRRRIEARTMLDGLRGSGISQRLDRIEDATTTLQLVDQQRLDTLNAIRGLLARRTAAGEHCPSLFAVEDRGRSGLMRRHTYRVSLWCEWPDKPHQLANGQGVYNITRLPDGLRDYLPFLHALIATLGIVIPVLAPAAAAAGIKLGEQLKGATDAAGKSLDALAKLPKPAEGRDFWTADAGVGPYRHAEIPADFRVLRNALTELDPIQLWGGLSAATRPEDNAIIYVCDTHLHALDHPYQHGTAA